MWSILNGGKVSFYYDGLILFGWRIFGPVFSEDILVTNLNVTIIQGVWEKKEYLGTWTF